MIATTTKRILLCLTLIIAGTTTLSAQKVEVLRKAASRPKRSARYFCFMEPGLDTSQLIYVATVRVSQKGKQVMLPDLFNTMVEKGHAMWANMFRLVSFNEPDSANHIGALVMDLYQAPDDVMKQNEALRPMNAVCFLGNISASSASVTLLLGEEQKPLIIKGGTYYIHVLAPGEKLKFQKGNLLKQSVSRSEDGKDKPMLYYGLSQIQHGGTTTNYYRNTSMGILGSLANHAWNIEQVSTELGRLLIAMLKPLQD